MTNDISILEELIPGISPDLKESFERFFSIIEQYNDKINLVSKGTVARAGVKHFSDCYQGLISVIDPLSNEHPIFDFGSGNGFPGIIAGMMIPKSTIILVERDQRKAEFLKIACDRLGLKNIEVYGGSVNDLADGSCHNIISRAMAPLPKFLLETRAVTAPGANAFLFKSDHWSTEFSLVPPQVFEFWEVEMHHSYDLPNNDAERFIIRCSRR